MTQSTPGSTPVSSTPTVVLIHGAFADSSSWTGVIERLQSDGIAVQAVVNPLRGVGFDSAYAASAFSQIPGPNLAVGHSYGGAVITNAGAMADNVVGLVYVAAFSPEVGETLNAIEAESKDSVLGSALNELTYPVDGGTEIEYAIAQDRFHAAFAADLPATQAAIMQVTQRPASKLAFTEETTAAAWKHLPSWAVIATEDKAAGTDVVRMMAQRANSDSIEVPGSHVIMVSQPQAVTDLILKALATLG